MQSGGAKGERWRIDFDILQGAGRWENPLMGWASSYVQGVSRRHGIIYPFTPAPITCRGLDYRSGVRRTP